MRREMLLLVVALGVAAGLVAPTRAAEPEAPKWTWPEHPTNIQVLPKEVTPDQLRGTMLAFTSALGVRCAYCHVGREGEPLSSYDFASDKNPMKGTTRTMMRMVAAVRTDYLAKIETSGPKRARFGCRTCHAGRARPQSLEEAMQEVIDAEGAEAAVARYRQLKERYGDRGAYDFGEESLSRLGASLLEAKRPDDALVMLRLNTEQFPQSGRAWEDLADAYRATGQTELARIFYRKALETDPTNPGALHKLTELAAGP
jgi:tetratricopeptide (TPR) repeat protein